MIELEAIKKAKEIINGAESGFSEIKVLVDCLKSFFQYALARELLTIVSQRLPSETWYRQQLALCTYKDHEIHPLKGFKEALEILEELGLRNPSCNDAETLALGGAVYKRKWEYDGQVENLYEALSFYRAAWERNPMQDRGCGGINAAFLLMILARRARVISRRSGEKESVEANELEKKAKILYEAITSNLTDKLNKEPALKEDYWIVMTLAEAYLGLGRNAEAKEWLSIANSLIKSEGKKVSEWEQQTTFRQIVSLLRLTGKELPKSNVDPGNWEEPWKTLVVFLGDRTEAALTCYRGKVGLALSGGGFRASLYHIGVLAKLAELDVLRSVEVLSTVSGGSILGAYYYLKLQKLLETKKDHEIMREDYLKIVEEMVSEFLEGVKENIRTKAIANFWKNLKIIFSKRYGRSNRLGELYEEVLYNNIKHKHTDGMPRYMDDLIIQPKGMEETFKPVFSNWQRQAKVPALLLNATTLNSGHNWRFTAKSMGEPPGLLGTDVDKNARYRRLYYEQAPNEFKRYRLGYAVAASACVPGLFDPLTLDGLYPEKIIRLVDGGVHDNQGVEGLLDEGCNFIFCSDASGQMNDLDIPSDSIPSVLLRSSSISMDRVREAEYQDLRGRADAHALHGLFFVHLKKDLKAKKQDWIGCQDPTASDENKSTETPYGIDPEIQELLSEMRTDLDSFTEVEAYSLMCSGYLMTEQQIKRIQERHENDGESGGWGEFEISAKREDWTFLKLESYLKSDCEDKSIKNDLIKQLTVSSSPFLKIWYLDEVLKVLKFVLACLGLYGLYQILKDNMDVSLFKVKHLVYIAAFLLLSQLPNLFRKNKTLKKLLDWLVKKVQWLFPEKALRNKARDFLLALVGVLLATIHLHVFDKMFLRRGSLSRLMGLAKREGGKG